MMSPLWQRSAKPTWVVLVVAAIVLSLLARYAQPVAVWQTAAVWQAAALVIGTLPWRLSTTARLTLFAAVLWPLVLAAMSRHAWPWAEVLVLLCWMWLSEVVQRWRLLTPQPVCAGWLQWPLSLVAIGALMAIGSLVALLWRGGAWTESGVIVAGIVVVINETGQVRRSLIALACGMILMRTTQPQDSLMVQLTIQLPIQLPMLLPFAVPVMRAGGVAVWPLLPGAVLVMAWQNGWSPLPIAIGLVALVLTSWVWDLVALPVRPAWRLLPPSWRWFTCAKLAMDPVYRLLAEDARPWGRVLDLGCGTGLGGVVAAQRGDVTHWRGVDLDARKIDVARRLLAATPGTSGWQTCIARLPLDATLEMTSADTVLALDILQYWPGVEQAALLVWMHAQLAPLGILWLREGTTDGSDAVQVHRGERFTTAIGLNPASTLFFHRATEWEDAFIAAGFSIVSRQPAGASNVLWALRREI